MLAAIWLANVSVSESTNVTGINETSRSLPVLRVPLQENHKRDPDRVYCTAGKPPNRSTPPLTSSFTWQQLRP